MFFCFCFFVIWPSLANILVKLHPKVITSFDNLTVKDGTFSNIGIFLFVKWVYKITAVDFFLSDHSLSDHGVANNGPS